MTATASSKTLRILLFIGRLALAAVFLVAAYAKLRPQGGMPWSPASIRTSLSMFALQVDSYQLLPSPAVTRVAHFLPPFELFLGLWLFSGFAFRYSALATSFVMAGFFALVVRTYAMGLEINCGCFGPGEQLGKMTVLRDGFFLALTIAITVGAFLVYRHHGPSPPEAPSQSASEHAG